MSQVPFNRACSLLVTFACLACGTQYADPIVELTNEGNSDICSQWQTQTDCVADTAHGCSFQPNTVGCLSEDASCGAGLCRGGVPYVSRLSQTLWLHGSPYRFTGVVSWGIAGWGTGCSFSSFSSHDIAINHSFDELVTMRVNVLRFWAFQSFAGATGLDFSRFDSVVSAARRAGIRLIPVLENMWSDCTEAGQPKTDTWFASGYRSPYGAYSLSYRDYVKAFVTRYRDEPTILAFELMHEARATNFASLNAFVEDMSQVARSNAPYHLISVGLDSGTSEATSTNGSPSYFQRLQAFDSVDLIDVHDFELPTSPTPANFSALLDVAATLKKPVFIGASAVELTGSTAVDYERRATYVEAKFEAAEAAGTAGFLVYEYTPNWTEIRWSFDGRAQEPLAGPNGVIAKHAVANP